MTDAVLVERHGGVAVLTLNRPDRRNSMTVELCDAFAAAAREVGEDKAVRCVVITGAGRSFCAGADFTTLHDLASRTGTEGPAAMHGAVRRLYEAFLAAWEIRVPTIAAVNGAAVGGGLGLALLCDLRVVSETAKIGANFARLGIHPGMGITALLPRAVGYEAAAELLFTGELIRGARAAEIGLASRAVPADEVVPAALELAQRIARSAPLALPAIKRSLRLLSGRELDGALEIEAYAQVLLGQTADAAEGVQAMMERRDPEFEGR